ncbi:MAG: recombinase RecT [Treponema sp.]|nr:recombinase RecT [Treponema sp.]
MKTDGSDQNEKGGALERSPVQSLKDLINSDYVKNRFMEVMGEKAPSFLASVLNATQKNPELSKCDQKSILSSAMVAATLDLPIDSNLGFAAIVPYNTKIKKKVMKDGKEVTEETWVSLAQFQIMYKGFIQLALRTGQYKTINVTPVYEDEFESYDIITGEVKIHPVANGYRERENLDKIIGYAAYFRLLNGFERIEYWSMSRLQAHGKRFSKSFKNPNSLWQKDPHSMYAKTPLKNLISKWGILSVTMQTANMADQAVIRDFSKPIDYENVQYVDAVSYNADDNISDAEDFEETVEQEAETKTESKEPTPEKPASKPAATTEKNPAFQDDEAARLEDLFEREKA